MPLINSNESGIDPGSEWLGNIPFSWSMVLLSQVVSQVKNKNSDLSEKNLLSLSYGKIKRKPIDTTEGLLPASFDGYNIIEANDIVLRLTDLQNDHTSLRVGISTEKGIITSAYITMRPKNSKTAKFLYYLLHTFDLRKGFYGMGAGVRQGLNYGEVKRLKIPFPAEDEQAAIANFLDNEIMRVDSIISEAKASIEEYKSWKASLIFEAVTKGLDPDVEMKDSGVEWIGEIPNSWDVLKLKYVIAFIESGVSVNASQSAAEEGKIGVLKTSSVSKYSFRPEENKEVNLDELDRVSCPVRANTIIVSRMNTPELVGACGYVEQDYPNLFLPDRLWQVHFINSVVVKYVWYYLSSNYIRNYYSSLSSGTSSSMQNISKGQFENARLLLPPPEVQRDIVKFLDKKCATLDSLVAEKESLIADLEAYKKSLIFEVVTGKRRVI